MQNNELTNQVVLRDVIEADLPIFFEHQLDPLACQMARFPSRGREAFMTHRAKILRDKNNHIQTIVFNGQVAGNIVSFVIEGEREVGYWIGRAFWGQGIATRALTAFLAYETERPLAAHVVKTNQASLRVLQKCGFQLTGEEGEELVPHCTN